MFLPSRWKNFIDINESSTTPKNLTIYTTILKLDYFIAILHDFMLFAASFRDGKINKRIVFESNCKWIQSKLYWFVLNLFIQRIFGLIRLIHLIELIKESNQIWIHLLFLYFVMNNRIDYEFVYKNIVSKQKLSKIEYKKTTNLISYKI